ncbi:hypothetical protein OKA05_15095 [Luteolibacter arcticus]|uniref:Uncharacterized protein n=1 Tax=Luteolibacter arcticus TaxID=1581411 RepID=A0ABT3GK65_9BACT|nr:hypothetical protein [Luteolibacter arcticus]MCW1923893.1 hypothetical protein [Luteolibacter arcticus]
MNLIPSDPQPPDSELIGLVDRYLDQRLDESGARLLEQLLRENARARTYCAERIRLHAEMGALTRPLRIEIHERRDLVFEQAGQRSNVTLSITGQVTVEPSNRAGARDVPVAAPPYAISRWWKAVTVVSLSAILGWIVFLWLRAAPEILSVSQLENPSFEQDVLADGKSINSVNSVNTTCKGWLLGGRNFSVVLNPATERQNNPYGGPHLPRSERLIDGSNVLYLGHGPAGTPFGWAKQRLNGMSASGHKVLQLGDLAGRTLRVTLSLARPDLGSGRWTGNDMRLAIGIVEDRPPWRFAAACHIHTGGGRWETADQSLDLKNDELTRVSFDLKVEPGDMRGDAYFCLSLDPSTPPETLILIDQIDIELVN